MKNNFVFVIPVYQSECWTERCIRSVIQQIYPNWQAGIVVDLSTDRTEKIVKSLIANNLKFMVQFNTVRKNALINRINCINALQLKDEDILVFLDGDDWLSDIGVLAYLDYIYQDENVWVTWGSYTMHPSNKIGGASQPTANFINLRNRPWIFSHLKTAKYFLWKNIKLKDLTDSHTGNIYQGANDMAYMYPMLEMAGFDHCKYIDRILYIYNYANPLNDDRLRANRSTEAAKQIKAKHPYRQLSKEELLAGHEDKMLNI